MSSRPEGLAFPYRGQYERLASFHQVLRIWVRTGASAFCRGFWYAWADFRIWEIVSGRECTCERMPRSLEKSKASDDLPAKPALPVRSARSTVSQLSPPARGILPSCASASGRHAHGTRRPNGGSRRR